ncbi:MAG TPA: carboxylesterase/lipase family protein [Thermoanaerobaculia bacterium]|nr:carboxylesterase/lipase family protein [Thermoanaerobaculia bacterium]
MSRPKARWWTLCLLSLLLSGIAAAATTAPVRLDSGLLEGDLLDAASGLRVFRGIPYAAPPVGDLRWRPPQRVAAWEGVRAAKEFGAICPQPPMLAAMTGETLPPSNEDCLYLNVWTAARADAALPVMVWIHGGGLSLGWSQQAVYDGAAFAGRGVVLVSINYRLGPLGFLSLPELSRESEHRSSGNYGFLDQVAALEWVQRNVAAFGGDPNNVTIFGESAGGTSVHALLTSPRAAGLYHRAIAESPWITESNIAPLRQASPFGPSAEDQGATWASRLVAAGGDSSLAALRRIPAAEIIAKSNLGFQPLIAIDGWFMPENGERTFAAGKGTKVPLIAGSNTDEGTMFQSGLGYGTVSAYRDGLSKIYGDQAQAVLALYPASSDQELSTTLNRYLTDTWFLRATRGMLLGAARAGAPTYQYHFTLRSRAVPAWGAHHAAELGFVFNNPAGFGGATPVPEWNEAERRLADAMIGYWVQFATTGDPNRDGLPVWPKFDAGTESYLELGETIRAADRLCAGRCEQLDRILGAVQAKEPQTGGR